ncbi:TPR repeat-containing protein [Phanerochaete sordida]|uniref:TPR repeat-containing protein n=1 Tax=Phanerochaete sordida TaxID=48140 RepID=A0A9P3FYM1_9APHY|nr:TPR repeat-containing protein [Phanerochaete sordida]
MPPKYSHVKKRPTASPRKPANNVHGTSKDAKLPDPYSGRQLSKPLTPHAELERTIAQILLLRFEQDIARLFSTHLYSVALLHLPTFVLRCINASGPGWAAFNASNDEVRDFLRAVIAMDLRQAGERVATKSVLWSYTALRHFATSNDVPICRKRGLHSVRLLPHLPALKAHLETLQTTPPPTFSKPPHLGPLTEGYRALEEACAAKYKNIPAGSSEADSEWLSKVRTGYERVSHTLWQVANEFDVRGYGGALRDKLTSKWCDCGCSTEHLSEVCEKTMKEKENSVRSGKEREWDGRGSGVYGWETREEEDTWDVALDQICLEAEEYADHSLDPDMTIGELMEWRYLRAELEKEQGNIAFKQGKYIKAVERYQLAHQIEPEMPHYQLNLAAAQLKMDEWVKAEEACDIALAKHKSVKGYWRRSQARKGQGRIDDAIQDLREVIRLQPSNAEAMTELVALVSPKPKPRSSKPSSSSAAGCSPKRSKQSKSPPPHPDLQEDLPFTRTYRDNFKLKISMLPLAIDVPVELPPPFIGANEKIKRPVLPSTSVPTRLETFSYPSWDRYVIQKVT